MRFNEKEISNYSSGPAVKEGRVHHKMANASIREGYKERWFKLRGNLLFYYRVNEYGAVCGKEPIGCLVIEHCTVEQCHDSPLSFALSLCFECDFGKKHYIGCTNQKQCDEWIAALNEASYQKQKNNLLHIKSQIMSLTGTDPLAAFSVQF